MAYKLIESEWCGYLDGYKKQFVVDTKDDIANLPQCCSGSSALVVNTGEVYMVNASGDWVLFGAEG